MSERSHDKSAARRLGDDVNMNMWKRVQRVMSLSLCRVLMERVTFANGGWPIANAITQRLALEEV